MRTDGSFLIESEELSPQQKACLGAALEGAAQGGPFVLEVKFFPPEEIRALNASARGVDRVTDVLSFPSLEGIKGKKLLLIEHPDCDYGDGLFYLGDLAVCCERAREQAEEYGHSYERELNYLIVHGVLHCLGYDHETEEERSEMRAKEEEIMTKMNLPREA